MSTVVILVPTGGRSTAEVAHEVGAIIGSDVGAHDTIASAARRVRELIIERIDLGSPPSKDLIHTIAMHYGKIERAEKPIGRKRR